MANLAKIIDVRSMLIYLVKYGLLLGVMAYFVYPKILKIIDERRNQISGNLDEAAKLRKDMAEQITNHSKEKDKLLIEIENDRNNLKKEFTDKKIELIKEMEEEKTKLMEEARIQINTEKRNIIINAEKQILSMIEKVIFKILSHQVPDDVVKKSVQEAWKSQK